jgi:hypothetical protein
MSLAPRPAPRLFFLSALLLSLLPAGAAAQRGEAPTFYRDVLPVLQQNCQVCHQTGGMESGGLVAPMSFETFESTRPWARAIAAAVEARRMPPWFADARHDGTFSNERLIADGDRATLVAWAAAGAPEGNPADAPPEVEWPVTKDGWWIGEPDLQIWFASPYRVEDDVHDQYITIQVELTREQLPEHRWVKARQSRPGGPHVHHITGGFGSVPGGQPTIYPDGVASLFQAGPRTIPFNMHYNKVPGPETAVDDLSGGGLVFYKPGEVIRHVVQSDPMNIRNFRIPAGDPNYSDSSEYTFAEDSYILRLNPHMHLRGKAAHYELFLPDGTSQLLLWVPRYDFNWQHGYVFREPVLAPAGSRLKFTATWDNSADNPHNPDPTVDMVWGGPTYMEMGRGQIQFIRAEPMHIVVGEPIPEGLREFFAFLADQEGEEDEMDATHTHPGDPVPSQ